jgi:hypothetical protein
MEGKGGLFLARCLPSLDSWLAMALWFCWQHRELTGISLNFVGFLLKKIGIFFSSTTGAGERIYFLECAFLMG